MNTWNPLKQMLFLPTQHGILIRDRQAGTALEGIQIGYLDLMAVMAQLLAKLMCKDLCPSSLRFLD
jgi:hypothetical protein